MARGNMANKNGLSSPPVARAAAACATTAKLMLSANDRRPMPCRRWRSASRTNSAMAAMPRVTSKPRRHGATGVSKSHTTRPTITGTMARRTETTRPNSRESSSR